MTPPMVTDDLRDILARDARYWAGCYIEPGLGHSYETQQYHARERAAELYASLEACDSDTLAQVAQIAREAPVRDAAHALLAFHAREAVEVTQ